MNYPIKPMTFFLIWLLSCPAIAEQQSYQDYAEVIKTVPVRHFQTGGYRTCKPENTMPDAPGIAEDIRQQRRNWYHIQQCNAYNTSNYESYIAGYQVTYRYHDYIGQKFVSQKPGNYLPVEIGLTPLP